MVSLGTVINNINPVIKANIFEYRFCHVVKMIRQIRATFQALQMQRKLHQPWKTS